MNATTAEARRLCNRVGQQFPTELSKPAKNKQAGAVKHPDGTELERAFDAAWKQFSGLPHLVSEYRFCATRRWRIDRAEISVRVAVEIEGTGHNKYFNFRNDMQKYNELSASDWLLFRCTAEMLNNDSAGFIALVVQAIERRRRQQAEQEKEEVSA